MLKKDAEQMEERLDSWRKENGIPLDKQKIQGKNILLEGMRYSEQIQALTDCYSLLFWLKSKE